MSAVVRLASVVGAALLASALGAAEGPVDLRHLFTHRAEIPVAGGGLARLELPPDVVARCRPDLSDLRLVDRAGHEVPFLLEVGREPTEARDRITPTLLDVERREIHTDDGPIRWRERYRISAPPGGEPWSLLLVTGQSEVVRAITVDEEGGSRLAAGSIFVLPGQNRSRTRVPLPASSATSLLVTLEGEGSSYLDPAFRFERRRSHEGSHPATVDLEILHTRQQDDRTLLEVERPSGLVPVTLHLESSTPLFSRMVEVWDAGPGRVEGPLARETLFRIGDGPAGLEIPIARPQGDRFRIVIHDGDSPPLADLAVAAAIDRPILLFAAPAEPATLELLFGGGRVGRARYDLEDLRPELPTSGTAAEIAERLLDPSFQVEVVVGPTEPNPDATAEPALAFAWRPGATLDRRRFAVRRTVATRPSAEGLNRLRLVPADLARARPDLGDLRIVDGDDHQWAYLVENDAGLVEVPLADETEPARDGSSQYLLRPDVAPVTVEALRIETAASFLDRAFRLVARVGGEESPVASGRLIRRRDDPRALEISFPPTRLDWLRLEVVDGDDAPLDLLSVSAHSRVPDLYFAAPSGSFELLLGDPDTGPPTYELLRVRDIVLSVPAGQVEMGPLEPNPSFHLSARFGSAAGILRLLLWLTLGLAVVGLLWITFRLVRDEPAPRTPRGS